jgi:hypothetical protein
MASNVFVVAVFLGYILMKAAYVVRSDSSTFRNARPPNLSKLNSILDLAHQMRGIKRINTATNLTEAALSMRDFFDKWKRASSQSNIGPNHETPLQHLLASHLLQAEGFSPAFSTSVRMHSNSSFPIQAIPAASDHHNTTIFKNDEVVLESEQYQHTADNFRQLDTACKNRIFYKLYGDGAEKVLMVMGLAASNRCTS